MELNLSMLQEVESINANWIAVVPEATLDRATLKLLPDSVNDFWGETVAANIEAVRLAKSLGYKVFLKPHIVLGEKVGRSEDKTKKASWRGDLKAGSEGDWEKLEAEYGQYIIELARLAEQYDVELFSIGTELKGFVAHRGTFWFSLIDQVRAVYSGKITYSANWDEYKSIRFWSELDYIGVDAYFPLSKSETPKVRQVKRKWKSIRSNLEKLSKRYDRQILFTEYGYRNISNSGHRPWEHVKDRDTASNLTAQKNLYQALYESVWTESWLAGGFLWKWFAKPLSEDNTDFTVQDKPAQAVVREWYSID